MKKPRLARQSETTKQEVAAIRQAARRENGKHLLSAEAALHILERNGREFTKIAREITKNTTRGAERQEKDTTHQP
uniref:Uncharacterized protein n=1 Tax=Candidatus Kentrum sp. UNK TaxID=2126344 RepID=A0A450ZYW1_9GAMM|nr:MAG: hypothetical protein BECKUNK1418G_GA0071005_100558 [Candidatus Kentron sp. UNK]VFK68644.1 MAG: hypothetical protein BECKUNK1418H_GA0071006_100458 [Candidatus Kentron sp. UNK]